MTVAVEESPGRQQPVMGTRMRELALEAMHLGCDLLLSPEFKAAVLPRPRNKGYAGGQRAGKSTALAADVYLDIMTSDGPKLYWAIMPTYGTDVKEMEYLRDWAKLEKPGFFSSWHHPQDGRCRLVLDNGRVVVETRTAQDPEGIASEAVDGVIICEAGQMPESVFLQAQGRIADKRGWVSIGGTIENDEAKPRWAWFDQTLSKWQEEPSDDGMAFSIPTWANLAKYPGGRQDPEILRLERLYDPHTFLRRVAGVPGGVQYPVYPQLRVGKDSWAWHGATGKDTWILSRGAGGHDYGTTVGHPSTLVAVQVNSADIMVVRECWEGQTGDTSLIESQRRLMSQKYGILNRRWGFDPLQKASADMAGAMAVKSGSGSRIQRAGMVEARLNNRKLLFDFSGPGVERLFAQMDRVHYVRREVPGQGWIYDYARVDDDMAAALENAVKLVDERPSWPKGQKAPAMKVNW